jgi:hypothetical protein
MPFSEFELKLIDKHVGEFCRTRVPTAIQQQLRYHYRIEKQNVLLSEVRPRWDNPDEWLTIDFAKLRYIAKDKIWKVYWMRASGKWELYTPYSECNDLAKIISVIKEDLYGCFFG